MVMGTKARSKKVASCFSLVNRDEESLVCSCLTQVIYTTALSLLRLCLPNSQGQRAPHTLVSLTGKGAQTPCLAGSAPPKSGLLPPAKAAHSCSLILTRTAGTVAALAYSEHRLGRSTRVLVRGGAEGGPSILLMLLGGLSRVHMATPHVVVDGVGGRSCPRSAESCHAQPQGHGVPTPLNPSGKAALNNILEGDGWTPHQQVPL